MEPEGRGTGRRRSGLQGHRGLCMAMRGWSSTTAPRLAGVYRTGKPARTTGFARPEGSRPARLSERGYQSSFAAPIDVEGNLWGALALADAGEEPRAEGSEQRLARFSEPVAQAIANADAFAQLAASRARLVEASDAERRSSRAQPPRRGTAAPPSLVTHYVARAVESARGPPSGPRRDRHRDGGAHRCEAPELARSWPAAFTPLCCRIAVFRLRLTESFSELRSRSSSRPFRGSGCRSRSRSLRTTSSQRRWSTLRGTHTHHQPRSAWAGTEIT